MVDKRTRLLSRVSKRFIFSQLGVFWIVFSFGWYQNVELSKER